MSQKRIIWTILLFFIASFDVCFVHNLEEQYGFQQEKLQLKTEEDALDTLRAFQLPKEDYQKISGRKQSEKAKHEALLACLFCQSADKKVLKEWCRREREGEPQRYQAYAKIAGQLLADAVYFPVPEALNDDKASLSYENSWQYERTYGGTRQHEGCDLIADIQQCGYYPIISSSSGIVEKMGWLPQGGYRIGIRSPHGVYYYYAHLAEYEEGLAVGTEVTAGQLLGYMGDTGYSEVEGTTGNFPVHLHFGMYLDNEEGEEVSYNPYYLLQLLEDHKLKYEYREALD